ncbi:MAG: hypothetical protein U9N40_01715 [Euryarchaeota archaeon]|nr:hypothetical protein [Euryarchaeota archaeon]
MRKNYPPRFKGVRDCHQNPAETEEEIHELLAGAQILNVDGRYG